MLTASEQVSDEGKDGPLVGFFYDFMSFVEDEDATDADEMTTFDGSTISLSLSPIMTPAKQGNQKISCLTK